MYIGIDLGSRFVKIVYGLDIQNYQTKQFDTIFFYKNFCNRLDNNFLLDLKKLKSSLNILEYDVKKIISTGYGRNLLKFSNTESISEIIAHFLGTSYFLSNITDYIILDIGGQDTKIISVKNSVIEDFFMNDKCASGSGRYLENMAKILDISVGNIGKYYENPIKLSNTCAIFGESEIISAIVNGVKLENIASGVNYSIFSRIKNNLKNFNQEDVVFVGGMSGNSAIVYFIEQELKKNVLVADTKNFNGAFGCFVKPIIS